MNTASMPLGSLSDNRIVNPLRRGQMVTIPAGTPFRTTHPAKQGVQRFKRAVTVRVFSASDGHVDLWNDSGMGHGYVCLPQFVYPGSGGYWVTVKMTPELCQELGIPVPALPILSDYDRRGLDAEPGYGYGYDDRDAT